MAEIIDQPISVSLISDIKLNKVYPYFFKWQNRIYKINQVGLHHTERVGRILFHIFSVTDGSNFFRLSFNTETLFWKLEEIENGF